MFEIIITTFIVNIRHFLLSASLNEKYEESHFSPRALTAFGTADEVFSVASMREGKVSSSYVLGIITISYSSWVIGSGLGHMLGASLPKTLQESMSIALYAMFIGLLVPSLKKGRKILFLAAIAASLHSIFAITHVFSTGWAIVISTLLSAVLVELIGTWKQHLKEEKSDES